MACYQPTIDGIECVNACRDANGIHEKKRERESHECGGDNGLAVYRWLGVCEME